MPLTYLIYYLNIRIIAGDLFFFFFWIWRCQSWWLFCNLKKLSNMNETVRSWWRGIFIIFTQSSFYLYFFIWMMPKWTDMMMSVSVHLRCMWLHTKWLQTHLKTRLQALDYFWGSSWVNLEEGARFSFVFFFFCLVFFLLLFLMRTILSGFMRLTTPRVPDLSLSRLFLPVERCQSRRSWPHLSSKANARTTAAFKVGGHCWFGPVTLQHADRQW